MRSLLLVACLVFWMAGCTGQEACSSTSGAFSCGAQVAGKTATENYTWHNAAGTAHVSWGGQASSGTFSVQVKDATGQQVYQRDFVGGGQQATNEDTSQGAPGDWSITIVYTSFTGQVGLTLTSGSGMTCPTGMSCPGLPS
ncbi:MAG: hypothetical protein ACYDBQ_06650 [Thermoplasmatota archaeon]